jgi:hypothetical protein
MQTRAIRCRHCGQLFLIHYADQADRAFVRDLMSEGKWYWGSKGHGPWGRWLEPRRWLLMKGIPGQPGNGYVSD